MMSPISASGAGVRHGVAHLRAHPSVVTWALFNEGLGQFDTLACAEEVHLLDPTRPIDAERLVRPGRGRFPKCPSTISVRFRSIATGDLAGTRLAGGAPCDLGIGGVVHAWRVPALRGHHRLRGHPRRPNGARLNPDRGLEGGFPPTCTQLSDVEEECNGILTYTAGEQAEGGRR